MPLRIATRGSVRPLVGQLVGRLVMRFFFNSKYELTYRVPNSERFLDISYHSILLNFFLVIFQNLYIWCFVFLYQGRNGQEFLSFLVVSPLFFWLSGCSELGHGFLIRNTSWVFKKLERSCKYEFATAKGEHIMKIYDEISDNWSHIHEKWKKKLVKIGCFFKSNEVSQSMFISPTFYVLTSCFLAAALSCHLSKRISIHSSVCSLLSNGLRSSWEGLR